MDTRVKGSDEHTMLLSLIPPGCDSTGVLQVIQNEIKQLELGNLILNKRCDSIIFTL